MIDSTEDNNVVGESAQNTRQQSTEEPGTTEDVTSTQTLSVKAKRTETTYGGLDENRRDKELTAHQKRVLRVLHDPKNHDKTEIEKARLARVSISGWYAILKDSWFKRQEAELMRAHLHSQLAPIMKASIDTARKPGRDGFADRRMLLETAEVYVPRSQVDHKHSGKLLVGVVGVSMEEL